MSYEFIKLSEVEQVETSYNANLLIEENGEIKRLSTANINFGGSGNQVQADWNETDDTSPAYIANKPNFNDRGVIKYALDCGGQMYLNGEAQTIEQVLEVWDSGTPMRVSMQGEVWEDGTSIEYPVVNIWYALVCGSMQGRIYFFAEDYIRNYWLT